MIECLADALRGASPRASRGSRSPRRCARCSRPDTRIYSVRIYDQSVPFYIGRTVTLVDYVDEFEPGLKAEPRAAHRDLDDFAARLAAAGRGAGYNASRHLEHPAQGLPMQLRARRSAPRPGPQALTPLTFSLLMTGVLLNAAAQLLLKAGTNRVGEFAFSLDNLVPIGRASSPPARDPRRASPATW